MRARPLYTAICPPSAVAPTGVLTAPAGHKPYNAPHYGGQVVGGGKDVRGMSKSVRHRHASQIRNCKERRCRRTPAERIRRRRRLDGGGGSTPRRRRRIGVPVFGRRFSPRCPEGAGFARGPPRPSRPAQVSAHGVGGGGGCRGPKAPAARDESSASLRSPHSQPPPPSRANARSSPDERPRWLQRGGKPRGAQTSAPARMPIVAAKSGGASGAVDAGAAARLPPARSAGTPCPGHHAPAAAWHEPRRGRRTSCLPSWWASANAMLPL